MKININLLPPEILSQQFKRANFIKMQTIGVIVILTMVFLTSIVVIMRILQSRNIAVVQAKVTKTQQKITELKDTQVGLLLLSDRLRVISEYWGISSKQSSMYKLIDKLTPPSVAINEISVNRGGVVTLLALAQNTLSMDNLITNLTTQESNESSINEVSIDSFNRGRDGVYRIGFTVKPK